MALHGLTRILGITLLLLVIAGVTTALNSKFVDPLNLYNLLRWTALFGILALGVAFVIITGGIDLSIGSVVALTGIVLMSLLQVTYTDSGERVTVVAADPQANTLTYTGAMPGFSDLDRLTMPHPSGADDIRLTIDAPATRALGEPNTLVVRESVRLAAGGGPAKLLRQSSMNPWLAVLIALGVGVVIGLVHGVLIGYLNLQPFIVTLCGLMGYRGLARLVSDDQTLSLASHHEGLKYLASGKPFDVPVPFINWISKGDWGKVLLDKDGEQILNKPGKQLIDGTGQPVMDAAGNPVINPADMPPEPVILDMIGWVAVPMPMLILLGLAVLGAVLLHKTVAGRYLLAMGRNEEAARFSGIDTKKMTVLAYVLCSTLAALGGVLFALDTNTVQPSSMGNFYELYAIAAAVLGGCSLRGGVGSIAGVVIGTAVMRSLYNAINLLEYPTYWEYIIIGGVLLIGVMIDELGRVFVNRFKTAQRKKKLLKGNV